LRKTRQNIKKNKADPKKKIPKESGKKGGNK